MSPSRRAPAIPILSPVLFIHVGHPYIPFLKFEEVLIYLYFIIEQDTLLSRILSSCGIRLEGLHSTYMYICNVYTCTCIVGVFSLSDSISTGASV